MIKFVLLVDDYFYYWYDVLGIEVEFSSVYFGELFGSISIIFWWLFILFIDIEFFDLFFLYCMFFLKFGMLSGIFL